MISEILRWGGVAPLDKQFVARFTDSASDLAGYRRTAASAAAAVVAGGAIVALAYFGVGYFRYSHLAGNEQAAAIHAENANAALQDELGRLRDRLGALTDEAQARQQQRSDVERKLVATEQASSTKADRIAQLGRALDQSQRQLHLTEAQRVTLMARLSKAEADIAGEESHKSEAQAPSTQSQRQLQQLQAERDALRARVNQLERKSSMLYAPAAPKAAAAAAPAPALAMAARKAALPAAVGPMPRATAAAFVVPRGPRGPVGDIEHVLASAGVDVGRLFSQFGVARGEGGPFVPVPRGGLPTLSPQKLAALRAMMKTLPVSAPLDDYRIGSPFGIRHDPFNGRSEFHTGIDFDAPYMSPIYATAAGVVTYAGYRSDYGKVVEIDHGHGLSTRYAHLHRFTVSVGEHVAAHSQIGYLGSSGRSTGPHVHYEVLVNGEPQDPAKFLALGRVIPVSAR